MSGEPLHFPFSRQCPFDPPAELAEIQTNERVRRARLWDGSTPWLVTGYAEVRSLLLDSRMSADPTKPGYPHTSAGTGARRQTFINMDGQDHDSKRRLLTRDFTVHRIESMRPGIQRLVDDYVDRLLMGPSPLDLVETFALPISSIIICDLLGVPYSERRLFQAISQTMISSLSTSADMISAAGAMHEFLGRTVSEKDVQPSDDLISRLVIEQLPPGVVSKTELVDTLLLLLVAGHETTANMIALGTLVLLGNQEALEELQSTDDPVLIAGTVEELLRYLDIVHNGRRRVATDDLIVAGQRIKAGEGVIAVTNIANRDPEVFENPDRLDIHRKNARRHLAFAHGVHQCLGQSLARVELQVVFGTLFRRIPTLRLAIDADDVRFKWDATAFGVEELPIAW